VKLDQLIEKKDFLEKEIKSLNAQIHSISRDKEIKDKERFFNLLDSISENQHEAIKRIAYEWLCSYRLDHRKDSISHYDIAAAKNQLLRLSRALNVPVTSILDLYTPSKETDHA